MVNSAFRLKYGCSCTSWQWCGHPFSVNWCTFERTGLHLVHSRICCELIGVWSRCSKSKIVSRYRNRLCHFGQGKSTYCIRIGVCGPSFIGNLVLVCCQGKGPLLHSWRDLLGYFFLLVKELLQRLVISLCGELLTVQELIKLLHTEDNCQSLFFNSGITTLSFVQRS